MRVDFAKNSYQSESAPISMQRCLNFEAEIQPEDAKSRIALFGTAGLNLFATCGTGPVRNILKALLTGSSETLAYIVSGNQLCSLAENGDIVEISGTISGGDNVLMAKNSSQLAIVADERLYIYTVAGGLVEQIGLPFTPTSIDYVDTFFVISNKDSRRFYISAAGDGTSWNSNDFAAAESQSDNLVRVLVDHRELWLFCEDTTEVWLNTGGSFPFTRQHTMERGINAKLSAAKLDNAVLWLGDDLVVYSARAYSPQRISTHAIEQEFKSYSRTDDATAYTYIDKGHFYYVLSFPVAGKTWVYDVAASSQAGRPMWHERSYFVNGNHTRHRSNAHTFAFQKNLVGDYSDGRIYEYDRNTYTDDGQIIQRQAIAPPIHADGKKFSVSKFEIDFEGGVGLVTGQGSDPQAMLDYTDDAGAFSNELWRSVGKIGERRAKACWRRQGKSNERTYRLTVSDPVKWVISGAYAEIKVHG